MLNKWDGCWRHYMLTICETVKVVSMLWVMYKGWYESNASHFFLNQKLYLLISDTLASCSTPNSSSQNTHTPLYTRPPVLFSNSSPSSPTTPHYSHTTDSPYANYWSTLYSPTLPPPGAIHRLLTTINFKFSNLSVWESLVIILDSLPSHIYTLPLTSNPFTSLSTIWRINFSVAVRLTLTL
jgi:hypothetical protein